MRRCISIYTAMPMPRIPSTISKSSARPTSSSCARCRAVPADGTPCTKSRERLRCSRCCMNGTPSDASSPPSSCLTVGFAFRRTRAVHARMSGFVSDERSWSRPILCGGQEQRILVGLTSLFTKKPPMLPKLNRRRALFVLTKIDEILAWEKRKEAERDTRFVELGRFLCQVRAGQYWRLENVKSFDEFLERRFPESRRKAYYLMSIHEHLPPQVRRELKEVGWTKGVELAKLARRDRQGFDCATWLHKARAMAKDQFKREVQKELTGQETEPWEIIYFNLHQSQIPVIEQAIETAALMLGTDKSRGYCLEMICADFLAGADLENGNSDVLLQSVLRFFKFLPGEERKAFLHHVAEKAWRRKRQRSVGDLDRSVDILHFAQAAFLFLFLLQNSAAT